MATFLGYESALAVLRDHASRGASPFTPARVSKLPTTAVEAGSGISGCPLESFVDYQAHILVANGSARSERPSCTSHVWSRTPASGSFYSLGDGYYVSTPEFLFLQMASKTTEARLIMLGYELCGTYVIDRHFARGFASSTEPLTSTSRIGRYLARCKGQPSVNKARTALRWVVDNSNSPMETTLSMLYILPKTQGGQHLSGIELNREFGLSPEWQYRLGRHSFKPDIYFPEVKVAVEYYGSDHDSVSAKEYDAARQALMEYLGIRVLGVSKQQIYNPDKYQGMLKQLYRLLGKQYRKPTDKQYLATLLLKDEILPGHDSARYLGAYWR